MFINLKEMFRTIFLVFKFLQRWLARVAVLKSSVGAVLRAHAWQSGCIMKYAMETVIPSQKNVILKTDCAREI